MTRIGNSGSRITSVLAVPAVGAGYYEDLAALQAEHVPLPERFTAPPVTAGFRVVRDTAEAVSVGLILDDPSDGRVAWGDCVAVSYSGKAGRDAVFRSKEGVETIRRWVAPALEGRVLSSFRELASEVDALVETVDVTRPLPRPEATGGEGVSRRDLLIAPARMLQVARGEEEVSTERVAVERRLHTAVRYGVSQALLGAVARARGLSMAEVIIQEWQLPRPAAPVPIHAQSGVGRYYNAEKMIVRRIASNRDALPFQIPECLENSPSVLTAPSSSGSALPPRLRSSPSS